MKCFIFVLILLLFGVAYSASVTSDGTPLTWASGSEGRFVAGQSYCISRITFTENALIDSMVIPIFDNYAGVDTVIGVGYFGTSSTIDALIGRSTDSIFTQNAPVGGGLWSSRSATWHFSQQAVSPGITYFGVYVKSSGDCRIQITDNNSNYMGTGTQALPLVDPFSLSEGQAQQAFVTVYYHSPAGTPKLIKLQGIIGGKVKP